MRELPEIETLRRALDKDVIGRKVKTVDVIDFKPIDRPSTKKAFASLLDGVKVTEVQRWGLMLGLHFDNEHVLLADLGKAGLMVRAANRDATPKSAKVVITFTQHGQLRFLDTGKTMRLVLVPAEELPDAMPEVDMLGIDPIETPVSWAAFGQSLVQHKGKLKTLLTDQTLICGLGPVYSDEILFRSGLRYDRMSDTLSSQEIRRLYRALVETIHDAIKYRGVSTEKSGWVDLFDDPGEYQEQLEVFERDKSPCSRCRNEITKAKIGGSNTYFCPQCQV